MSTELNLSTRPFRNRMLPWSVSITISVISIVLLVFVVANTLEIRSQTNAVARDVHSLRQQSTLLQQQASQVREALTPQQRSILEAAHSLVDRKRFSWSRLFSDLETAIPSNVRVSRINIRDISVRGGVTVADMTLNVVSKDASDVTRMIESMSRAGVFHAEVASQNPLRAQTEAAAEWSLQVRYSPRAVTTEATVERSVASASQNNDGSSEER